MLPTTAHGCFTVAHITLVYQDSEFLKIQTLRFSTNSSGLFLVGAELLAGNRRPLAWG
ncbi:uncharacterized protein PHALS_00693 [Plasmopara halstedii]|uniref:RxLR-like protein n=1 Tax=Plasmopara halstedii TaxID=4781 RepID=A0A0P1ATM2_PLAHL|nr:uncharacterized protein PHALS_00693 [Plasmopara halstedii]CEG44324.1 hypothetical protein PHALS_00693 [Plasmopara halstedii]|eukprot:XP_024580693.1 hypothetical protein PHALS_00693 [Plasmopara halstedii]